MQKSPGEVYDLAAHPRLYIPAPSADPGDSPFRRRLAHLVAAAADDYVGHPDFQELPATHNAHLIRARLMQQRVVTLIARWRDSADRRYRDSALAHLETIGGWEYWSWITWRKGDARPEAIFDLSYGENSATLALGYDLLYADFDADERRRVVEIARRRSLAPFLDVVGRGAASWFAKPDTNWNTVCAGGAGMLALAMHEDLAEARAVLPLVEQSIAPFMRMLEATDGGWPEGIGYWGYGMSYAFMYLLSHERATGAPHPLLVAEATRRTIEFPFDFCPHGQACSFGDSNHWGLAPVQYRAAQRLGSHVVLPAAAAQAAAFARPDGSRQHAAEALLLGLADPSALVLGSADPSVSGSGLADPSVSGSTALDADPTRIYRGLGWVRLADRWPAPRLYLAIRGGATGVPHGHRDLLSFHVVVGGERLVENLTPSEYLDTTFGPRRDELFEMGAQSKNVPLINGVGVTGDARVVPQPVDLDGSSGVVLDATAAMGGARDNEQLADFCGRLFIVFGAHAALVLDRIDLQHEGRVENRLHTRADVKLDGRRAVLTGADEQLTAVYAAQAELSEPDAQAPADDAGFGLVATPTTPTTPGDDATMLRWHGPAGLGRRFVMATLLAPGAVDADVELETLVEGRTRVRMRAGDWSRTITVGPQLTSAP